MIKDQGLVARTQHFEYQNPIGGYRYMAWNESRNGKPTFFAECGVRQAMTMLLDRKRMIDQVMLGYAVEATGPFNPLQQAVQPGGEALAVRRRRPRWTLLKEAGFPIATATGCIESRRRHAVPVQADLSFGQRELREDGAVHEGCVCPGGHHRWSPTRWTGRCWWSG